MSGHLRYVAFISYSQRDKPAARRIQQLIETYRIPGAGAGTNRKKLGRVFRDDDEMAAAADLGAALRGAIEDTENLVVICSPNSARSIWVNAEIDHFRKTGRGDKVFAIIVRGKPNSGDPETECLPPLLRTNAMAQEGSLEPLALDLRKEPKRRLLTRLAAGFLSLPFDALWKREQRRQRQRRLVTAFASLLVFSGAIAGSGAIRLRQLGAQDQADSASYVLAARQALDENRPARAARIAMLASEWRPWRRTAPEAPLHLLRLAGEKLSGSPEFNQHDKAVNGLAFSPDGVQMATASDDGSVIVWNLPDGSIITVLTKFLSSPEAVIYSADGQQLIVSDGLSVSAWDTATWTRISEYRDDFEHLPRTFDGAQTSEGALLMAGALPDGGPALWSLSADGLDRVADHSLTTDELLYSACSASTLVCARVDPEGRFVEILDMRATAELPELAVTAVIDGHEGGSVGDPSLSADGTILALKNDSSPEIWDISGPPRMISRADFIGGNDLLISPDGKSVLFTARDGASYGPEDTLFLWDTENGSAPRKLIRFNDREISRMAFAPGGQHAMVAMEAGDVISVPLSVGGDSKLHSFDSANAMAAAFSPDGKWIALALEDGRLQIASSNNPETAREAAGLLAVESIHWSADGAWITIYGEFVDEVAETATSLVRVFDSADLSLVAEIDPFTDMAETSTVYTQAFSPDGRWLAIGGSGAVYLWPTASWSEPVILEALDEDGVQSDMDIDRILFSADSQHLISANDWGSLVRIWNIDSRSAALVDAAADLTSGVVGIDLRAGDGKFILRSQTGDLILADPEEPAAAIALRDRFLPSDVAAAVSGDGRTAAFQNLESIVVWDLEQDKEIQTINLGEYAVLRATALNQDGTLLAVADIQTGVKIFDSRSGTETASIPSATEANELSFSPRATQLLMSGFLEPAQVWSLLKADGPSEGYDAVRRQLCDDTDGKLTPPQRLVTQDDVADAPFLASAVGRDVCQPDRGLWRQFLGID